MQIIFFFLIFFLFPLKSLSLFSQALHLQLSLPPSHLPSFDHLSSSTCRGWWHGVTKKRVTQHGNRGDDPSYIENHDRTQNLWHQQKPNKENHQSTKHQSQRNPQHQRREPCQCYLRNHHLRRHQRHGQPIVVFDFFFFLVGLVAVVAVVVVVVVVMVVGWWLWWWFGLFCLFVSLVMIVGYGWNGGFVAVVVVVVVLVVMVVLGGGLIFFFFFFLWLIVVEIVASGVVVEGLVARWKVFMVNIFFLF